MHTLCVCVCVYCIHHAWSGQVPPCTIEPSSSWCNSMYPRPVVSTFFHLLRAQEGCSVRCLDSIDYSTHAADRGYFGSRRCSVVVLTCTRTSRPQPGRSLAAAPRSKPAPEPPTPCAASDSCLGTRVASRFRTCRCSWASCDRSTCGMGKLNSETVM